MQRLLAIAELRIRGGVAAQIPWLVPAALAAGFALAGWVPGTEARARAVSADDLALSGAAALAVLTVLVLATTTFADEIRTAVAQPLLAAPVSRGTIVVGGAAGHAAFGLVLALALGAAASLGLDLAGLGAGARGAVRPYAPASVEDPGPDGRAVLSVGSPEVRLRFRVPDPLPDELVFRMAPRGQVETDFSPAGTLDLAVAPADAPGRTGAWHRVAYRAGRTFQARLDRGELRAGEESILVVRRIDGGWLLRFADGWVEVGGARELFAWNAVKAAVCLLPLLAMTAAAGAAASARLGAAASLVLVLFLALLFAGRDVIVDAAEFVVEEGAAQTGGRHQDHPGHEHHDHTVDVSPLQVALARGALAGMRVVPEAGAFWRFDDLAEGRAVTARQVGGALLAGLAPTALLLGASWFLLRRREIEPE